PPRHCLCLLMLRPPPGSSRFPYTTLFRSPWPGNIRELRNFCERMLVLFSGRTVHPENLPREFHGSNTQQTSSAGDFALPDQGVRDRKSTRLNSSHVKISYAVFCLKKKTTN